jgi:hypothetical protein
VSRLDPGSKGADTTRPGGEVVDPGVEGNARLTGSNSALLIALLAVEGVTILSIRSLLGPHVFVGMLLIPPVALKIGSTSYRFARYYQGAPAYRRKGPPPLALRPLGPVVVVLTVVVLASGVGLMFVADPWRQRLLTVHKASFVLWFGAMTIHVLAHLPDTVRLASRDWISRAGRRWPRAGARRWTLVASVAAGVVLGVWLLGRVSGYLATSPHGHGG